MSPQASFWSLPRHLEKPSETINIKNQLFAPEPVREICSFRAWDLGNGTPVIYRYVSAIVLSQARRGVFLGSLEAKPSSYGVGSHEGEVPRS